MWSTKSSKEALQTPGELLRGREQSIGLLVGGGAGLLLLGLVQRPTADVDVVALAGSAGYGPAAVLPSFFTTAVRDVGDALGLGGSWLNLGPAGLMDLGLPDGLAERVTIRRYSALEIHLPARPDLICFKLYAAVDQGERSKHFADLAGMAPTVGELMVAARRTRTHDPSPGFLGELRRILGLFDLETRVGDL